MHKIEKASIGRFSAYRLFNDRDEYFEVLADLGAALNDFVVQNESGEFNSLIRGYRTEQEILNIHHSFYLGSKLSPICNRIVGGKYKFENESHQLVVNEVERNNHLHGLLHYRSFDLLEATAQSDFAQLQLKHDYLGTDLGFPFPYKIELEITLVDRIAKLKSTITNTGDKNMPIADGWHPYFTVNSVETAQLYMSKAKRVSSMMGNELGEYHGFENGRSILEPNMDDCFHIDSTEETLYAKVKDTERNVGVQLTMNRSDSAYDYFHIYTPSTKDMIAIEPVSCPPNSFNTGEGLIVLLPGENRTFEVSIEALLF